MKLNGEYVDLNAHEIGIKCIVCECIADVCCKQHSSVSISMKSASCKRNTATANNIMTLKVVYFFPVTVKRWSQKAVGCTRKFHNRNILLHIYMQNCALLHCRHCRLDNTRICVTEIVVVFLHFYKMPKITQRLRKIGFYFRSISHCEMKNGEKGCANFLLENANVENEND